MALLIRIALIAMLGSCYSPSIKDCDFRCGPTGECPSDTTCGSDGWCHVDPASVCSNETGETGETGEAATPSP